jgi:hypothetical protein
VRNELVLHRVKEEGNILHKIKRRKDDWIGNIFCRNCFLKHVIWRKDRGKDRRDQKDEEEDVSNYWVTIKIRKDIGN